MHVRALRLFVASVAVLLSTPAGVQADAIGVPDAPCPEGASMTANHAGAWCRPSPECASDAACPTGERCSVEPVALCVVTETYRISSNTYPPVTSTREREVARGPCGDACAAPARCEAVRRCVEVPAAPRAAPPAEPPREAAASAPVSPGCAARRCGDAGALPALGLAALGLSLRRRRTR